MRYLHKKTKIYLPNLSANHPPVNEPIHPPIRKIDTTIAHNRRISSALNEVLYRCKIVSLHHVRIYYFCFFFAKRES